MKKLTNEQFLNMSFDEMRSNLFKEINKEAERQGITEDQVINQIKTYEKRHNKRIKKGVYINV